MTIKSRNKVITTSDSFYLSMNWAAIFLVLTIPLIGWTFSYNYTPVYLKIILTILTIVFSAYIASFFYLYKVTFYQDKIVSIYQIKFPTNRDRIIDNTQIEGLRFIYTDGKGSGGTGTLKIYYTVKGYNKILRCPISPADLSDYYKVIKDSGIIFELVPKNVLEQYLN